MTILEKLKTQSKISRSDIGALLASIGKPGEKREEKIAAVKELNRSNRQGHDLSESLESYSQF